MVSYNGHASFNPTCRHLSRMVSSTYPIWGSGSIWDTNLVLIAQHTPAAIGCCRTSNCRSLNPRFRQKRPLKPKCPYCLWYFLSESINSGVKTGSGSMLLCNTPILFKYHTAVWYFENDTLSIQCEPVLTGITLEWYLIMHPVLLLRRISYLSYVATLSFT